MEKIEVIKYKNKLFETEKEFIEFRERELIYCLEDLILPDEYGNPMVTDVLGLLIEYGITSKKKLIELIGKF